MRNTFNVYILPEYVGSFDVRTADNIERTFRPFFLFELLFSTPIYMNDSDLTCVWSGNVYAPSPIKVGQFGKSTTNLSDTLTLVTHNVDREFSTIILNENIQGKQANIYQSEWVAPGSYSNPIIVYRGQFDSMNISEGYSTADVSLEIKNDFIRWDMSVPRASFAGTCQWPKFKSTTPGCQYTGVASLCNRTWERCAELNNTHRFRGFRFGPMLEDKEVWWGR